MTLRYCHCERSAAISTLFKFLYINKKWKEIRSIITLKAKTTLFYPLIILFIFIFLAGCGSSGGGISRPDSLTPPNPNTTPIPTPTPSAGETIGWVWQNPVPTYDTLWSSCKIGTQTAWTAGARGNIFKTTDSGQTWSKLPSNTLINLFSVCFVDQNNGWCSGANGVILHSTDGGSSWTAQNSPTMTDLNSIYFANTQIGWACGTSGKIIATNDGGANWFEQTSGTLEKLYSIKAFNANNAWAVGQNGTILITTNGGTDWIPRPFVVPANIFYDIYFTAEGTGYIAGEIYVYSTNDNWATANLIFQDPNQVFYSLSFTDANHGFVLGNDNSTIPSLGVSYYTDNGFFAIPPPNFFEVSGQPVYSSFSPSEGTACIFGGHGMIKTTANTGADWTTISPIFRFGQTQINGIFFINTKDGFVVGDNGTIMKTNDEGYNWAQIVSPSPVNLNNVWFINQSTGFIVGNDGIILKSTDSGDSWSVLNSGTTKDLYGLDFITHPTEGWSYGWACGEGGEILFSKDTGNTWEKQVSPTTNTLRTIDMLGDFTGLLSGLGLSAGDNGTLIVTTSMGMDMGSGGEGAMWRVINTGTAFDFSALSVLQTPYGELAKTIYFGGANSLFAKSNFAVTQLLTVSLSTLKFTDAHFTDYITGWTIGNGTAGDEAFGNIYYTSDGGVSWIDEYKTTGLAPLALYAVNSNVAWIAGSGGLIMHTTDGGKTNRFIKPLNSSNNNYETK